MVRGKREPSPAWPRARSTSKTFASRPSTPATNSGNWKRTWDRTPRPFWPRTRAFSTISFARADRPSQFHPRTQPSPVVIRRHSLGTSARRAGKGRQTRGQPRALRQAARSPSQRTVPFRSRTFFWRWCRNESSRACWISLHRVLMPVACRHWPQEHLLLRQVRSSAGDLQSRIGTNPSRTEFIPFAGKGQGNGVNSVLRNRLCRSPAVICPPMYGRQAFCYNMRAGELFWQGRSAIFFPAVAFHTHERCRVHESSRYHSDRGGRDSVSAGDLDRRHVQRAGGAAKPLQERLLADRRAAQAAVRPDSEPG